MIAILGAGGAISHELLKHLRDRQEPVRLVSRHPHPSPGGSETMSADLSILDHAVKAVAGARVAFLLAGLKYDINVWRELWPRIMKNTIEAAKRSGARLVFFDNVYMYGRVNGVMTEETPFSPSSRKGQVRADIANMLLEEMKSGNVTGLIARSADFYGPDVRTGIPNIMIFEKLANGGKAMWLGNDSVRHSFTFTPDAARGLVQLLDDGGAWNQTWHLPTAPDPPTGKEFIEMVAKEFGTKPKYRVLGRTVIKLGGLFDTTTRELSEMLYQNEFEYIFDSTKFNRHFGFEPTSYPEGIRITADAYRRR